MSRNRRCAKVSPVRQGTLECTGANGVRLILRDTEQQSLTAVDYKSQERARL